MSILSAVLATSLAGYGAWETRRHQRNLRRVPVRIHVNGTRGKSSVTRLIAGGLRAGGCRVLAKTTGTSARMILPDGSEVEVYRFGLPNIIEQVRVFQRAVEVRAEAVVIECMAVSPLLQPVSELRLIQSTVGVITNVRADHLDVMGPTIDDVALAMGQTAPRAGHLFTAERERIHLLEDAARSRGSRLHRVGCESVNAGDLAGFSHVEHAENVALALAVCRQLGVNRETAIRGMHSAAPDPGALQRYTVSAAGKTVTFVNAFAANDPDSTRLIWSRLGLDDTDGGRQRVLLANLRKDRLHRSKQITDLISSGRIAADQILLVGDGTGLIASRIVSQGVPKGRVHDLGGLDAARVYEGILERVEDRAIIVGIGNIVGLGEQVALQFRSRAVSIG
jgi:gamma-polyglutamate synthase